MLYMLTAMANIIYLHSHLTMKGPNLVAKASELKGNAEVKKEETVKTNIAAASSIISWPRYRR